VEAERDQRILPRAVANLEPLAQVVGGIRGVGAREVDDDQAEGDAHARRGRGLERRLGEEIHVVEAGDAAAQHLGAGERGAVAHELRRHVLHLGGPDVLLQPALERQVVGQAAHQRHGGVRMRVDQARDENVLGQLYAFIVLERGGDVRGRKNAFDGAVADGEGVVL